MPEKIPELSAGSPPQSSREFETQTPLESAPRGEEFDFPDARLAISNATKDDKDEVKKRHWGWLVAGALAIYCVYFFAWTQGFRSQKPVPVGIISGKNAAPRSIQVFVVGAVKKPGVYSLPATARIQDALQKAGGTLPKADAFALNLADWVIDGSKIEVPFKAAPAPTNSPQMAVEPTPTVIIKEVFVTPPTRQDDAPSTSSPSKTVGSATPSKTPKIVKAPTKTSAQNLALLKKNPVDLNRATLNDLEKLPGVGPKMAERIVAYRAENGGFKSVDDLDNVRGIGEKKLAVLKDLVRVK